MRNSKPLSMNLAMTSEGEIRSGHYSGHRSTVGLLSLKRKGEERGEGDLW